jgi:hypothetical protein
MPGIYMVYTRHILQIGVPDVGLRVRQSIRSTISTHFSASKHILVQRDGAAIFYLINDHGIVVLSCGKATVTSTGICPQANRDPS